MGNGLQRCDKKSPDKAFLSEIYRVTRASIGGTLRLGSENWGYSPYRSLDVQSDKQHAPMAWVLYKQNNPIFCKKKKNGHFPTMLGLRGECLKSFRNENIQNCYLIKTFSKKEKLIFFRTISGQGGKCLKPVRNGNPQNFYLCRGMRREPKAPRTS